MPLGWSVFYAALFLYRSSYAVLGEVFISKLTSLGDSARYQTQSQINLDPLVLVDSTLMTEVIGAILYIPAGGSPVLISIGFQAIGFLGIWRFLTSVKAEQRSVLIVLLAFPSFTLWSSVASKEAVIVFAIGVIAGYFVKLYDNRERLGPLEILAGYIMLLYKPHYAIALLYIFLVSKLARHVRQKATLALLIGVVSLLPLYLFRDVIDELSFAIIPHFSTEHARSTREAFWVESYDVFWKAPYGMWQGFFGPTMQEAGTGILQLLSFFESLVLVGIMIFFVVRQGKALPVYSLITGGFTAFWIMFPNYPFGILNPGSAVRYRTGYLMIVLLVFLFIMSRSVYATWVNTPRMKRYRKRL